MLGALLGTLFEWVWIDRIPAGGIRVPAADVGVAAGVVALTGAAFHDGTSTEVLTYAVAVAALAMMLYVPLDGGLRRLWNLASENALSALERNSLAELRLLTPVALILRATLTAGLLGLAPLAMQLMRHHASVPPISVPWTWVIPAAVFALLTRTRWQWLWQGGLVFAGSAAFGLWLLA